MQQKNEVTFRTIGQLIESNGRGGTGCKELTTRQQLEGLLSNLPDLLYIQVMNHFAEHEDKPSEELYERIRPKRRNGLPQ